MFLDSSASMTGGVFLHKRRQRTRSRRATRVALSLSVSVSVTTVGYSSGRAARTSLEEVH